VTSSDVEIATRFSVRLTPRGGRDAVDGAGEDGVLRVRVAAPPTEGAANRALLKLLAVELRVPVSALTLDAGASSRTKRLRVGGLAPEALAAHWPGLSVGPA
jgi:uncharacterized protein YggU (UPF0235/DUF167 family)